MDCEHDWQVFSCSPIYGGYIEYMCCARCNATQMKAVILEDLS